jgi:hypothetical protein
MRSVAPELPLWVGSVRMQQKQEAVAVRGS